MRSAPKPALVSRPKLTLDGVAVGQGGLETVEDVGHGLEDVTS